MGFLGDIAAAREGKLQSLQDAKVNKLQTLTSLVDADSGYIKGMQGENRFAGFDAYEVRHSDPESIVYFKSPQGQKKMERQREVLASQLGIPKSSVTDDMIYNVGMDQTYQALNELNTENVDLISRTMRPDGTGNIFGKDKPLNLPVQIQDQGKDYYGRGLIDIKGKGSDQFLSQKFNTPEFNTDYGHTYNKDILSKERQDFLLGGNSSSGRLSNLVDALQYGIGRKAAGAVDAIVDAGGAVGKELYKMKTGATDEQAQKHFTNTMLKSFAKDYYNEKGDFIGVDKYKTAKEYGYDPTNTETAMADLGKAWDSGSPVEMVKAVARNVQYAPEFIGESAGEFLTAPMRSAGIILNTFDYANKTLERRQQETGKEYTTLGDKALAGLTGWGQAVLNKLGGDEVIGRTKVVQSIVERVATMAPEKLTQSVVLNAAKRLGGALTVATGKGLYEGTEEVMQQFLDIVGARIGDDNANKIFSNEVGKELFQSFGAGFSAGAGLRAPIELKNAGTGVLDATTTVLNKASEMATGRTAEDVRAKKAGKEQAIADLNSAISSRAVKYTEDMTPEQIQGADMVNSKLNEIHEQALEAGTPIDEVMSRLEKLDSVKQDLGFTTPTTKTAVEAEATVEPVQSKVEYESEEVQKAGIANVLTRSDKIKAIRIEAVTGDTRVQDASSKKNKVMSVFSTNDDVIQNVLDGKMNAETAAKMTNATEGNIINFAKRLGKKLSPTEKPVEVLKDMNAKISDTLANDAEAQTALQNLYGEKATSQKGLKVVVMAVDAVHSAMRSEHDISKKYKLKQEGVSEARRQEVAHQLGKEFMNSHELRIAGKPEETAKAYIELGESMLKLAEKAGYIESGMSDVAIHNMHDADGKRLSDDEAKKYYAKGAKKGTIQVPTVKVSGITDTSRGAFNEVVTASNVLSKLFKPVNYELPTEIFVDEVPTESKISKEHEKIIKDYNKMVYSVKPEALKVLREIKDYIDKAYNGDTDKALASDQILKSILGLQKSDAEIRKDTEGGQAIGRKGTITNLLDNLDFIEQGGLHFNYESAINQRIHVMQTILDFQGDKYMARQILQGGSGKKKADGMARQLLLNTVADELKGWTVEDVENVPSATIQKYMDMINETGSIPFNEMVKLQKAMKVKSPFKALSLLQVLSDIRASKGGAVETAYQVESDATASGVVNTLLNLSGHKNVQDILKLLGIGEMEKGTDPYNFIAKVLEKSPAYDENIKPILYKLKAVGLDARSVAKYPIMKWFYGQLDKNNNADMGESIADDLVDLTLYEYNQKAMDLINEILGEKKYAIDTMNTSEETPISEMTDTDKKVIADYYMNNIATEYTEALNVQFAEVSGYRKKMGSIYKLLNDSKLWKGTIRTAMDALLESKTPSKMSVKKLKNTVFKEDGTTYTTNKMMNNETSFNVNLQHATDAALLLMSIRDIMGDVVDSGVMTVHDALYSDPQTALKIMERYNHYTKEAAVKYDYMDAALQELNDVIQQMEAGAVKDKYIKEYNAMKAENDVLMKEKARWMEGKELNILGDWEVGNIQAKERAEKGTKTKVETTVEEKNAEVYNDVKSIIEALKSSNKDTVKSTLSRVMDLITVKNSHKALVEMIKKALDDKTLAVMQGDNYEALIKGVWLDTATSNTIDPRFHSTMSNEDLVELIAHEISHAYQMEYIYAETKKGDKATKDIKYLQKVMEKVTNLPLGVYANLSEEAQSRVNYISSKRDAEALSEMVAILSAEVSVSNEIIGAVTSNKERVLDMINKLVQKVKDWINGLSADRQKEIISKALSENVIATGAIQAALNQLDANARVMSATTEFSEDNHGVKLRAATKAKDTIKDIPLNPLTAVNDAIAKSNRVTADWMIIWADVIDEAVSPKVMKAHMKLKHASSLYREGISLLRTGFYDSEFAQKMHYLLGLAGDVTDQVIKKSLSMFTTYQQESAKEREAMAEMDRQIKGTYSKKDRVTVHQLFADTGIANLVGMPEVKMDLFNGTKTVEQLIEEVKAKIPSEKLKDLDAVANEWVNGNESGLMVNVRQAKILSNEAYAYTTLKAINMIPNGEKILKGMDKNLRNWMMSMAMLNKKLNDEINEMKLNYDGKEYSENKEYYAMYDGSYSRDIHDKVFEYRAMDVKDMRNSRYSEENGWIVIREPKGNVKGIIARESLSGGRVAGVGLEANRYMNGAFISVEQSQEIAAELSKLSDEKQLLWLKENKMVKDGNRYRVLLPKDVKVEKLHMVQNAAHSLYRTYIHNKELIQSESVRKLLLEEGTHYIDSKAGMKKLEQTLRDNDRNGVRGKLGKRVEVKPFISIDFKNEGLKEIRSFEQLKKEYPMIAKYFKTAEGVTSFNGFNKEISLVKRGVSDVLLGHKNFSIFGDSDNRELAKWENMFKKIIVLAKQKMVVTNPVKLLNDSITNLGVLSMMDIGGVEIYQGMKDGFRAYKEYAAERSKYVTYQMEAKMAQAMDDMEPSVENEKKVVWLKKKAKQQLAKLETLDFHDAFNYGFVQSYSTDLVIKEFDTITGIQQDIDTFIDKYTHDKKGNPNKLFGAIKWWQNAGFGMDDVFRKMGEISKVKGTDVGTEMVQLADRLKNKKNDKESVARYLSDYMGSPASEMVNYGSAYMVLADALSKYVLAKHLMEQENPRGERGKRKRYTKEEAYSIANDTFVDYRTNLPAEIKALSDYGIMMFPAFWMKIQRTIAGLIKYHPVSSSLSYGIENMMGAESLNIMNQSLPMKFLGGNGYQEMINNPLDVIGPEALIAVL